MQIIKNPDLIKYIEALKALSNNDGYRLDCEEKTLDNKCPCKEFVENNQTGVCYCGRYVKTEL